MLSPEETKRYEAYFGMFGTPEWKMYVQEISELAGQARLNMADMKTTDDMLILKGRIQSLEFVMHYERMIENDYNNKTAIEDEIEIDDSGL